MMESDGFIENTLRTNPTPARFIVFVSLFVVISIGLAAPLVNCWIQRGRAFGTQQEQQQELKTEKSGTGTADQGSSNVEGSSNREREGLDFCSKSQELTELRRDNDDLLLCASARSYSDQLSCDFQEQSRSNHEEAQMGQMTRPPIVSEVYSDASISGRFYDNELPYDNENRFGHNISLHDLCVLDTSFEESNCREIKNETSSQTPQISQRRHEQKLCEFPYDHSKPLHSQFQQNDKTVSQEGTHQHQNPLGYSRSHHLTPNPLAAASRRPSHPPTAFINQNQTCLPLVTSNFRRQELTMGETREIQHGREEDAAAASEHLSSTESAATTSQLLDGLQRRLHPLSTRWRQQRVSTKSLMLWNNSKPLPRTQLLHRSVEQERHYVRQLLAQAEPQDGSPDSVCLHRNNNSNINPHLRSNGSEAAGSAHQGDIIEDEAEYYRQKFKRTSSAMVKHDKRYRSSSSVADGSISDSVSILPPLPLEAIYPDDGLSNIVPTSNPALYEGYLARFEKVKLKQARLDADRNDFPNWLNNLLDLAEADHETKRIFSLSIPTTVGAGFDPIFRLILIILISNFVDTNSMAAYLLVNLIIRLTTEEISGAVSGAESIMLQAALIQGGDLGCYQAGRFLQLALTMQLLIGVPLLVMWLFLVDNVVMWLVEREDIARLSSSYAAIVGIDYALRDLSKIFMLPFYITNQANFERTIDIISLLLTTVSIVVVAVSSGGSNSLTLRAVAWIQVIFGVAKTITKVAYVFLRGWLHPFKKGLLGKLCLKDPDAVRCFFFHARPQFLGSLVELREWDLLSLFVRYLGSAEVVTWALMGAIWDVFAALTDGLGEAALVRVAFYLGEGLPSDAKRLSHKVLGMACVLVLIVTSIFLMLGPRIAVLLTKDITLQHLLNDLVGMTGLAYVSVTAAQIYWSLAGAQGGFEFASATILFCRWLLILPLSALIVFYFSFDPKAVAGIVAAGYATAAFILACKFFSTDWEELSRSSQEEDNPRDGVFAQSPNNDVVVDAVAENADEVSSSSEDEEISCSTSSYADSVPSMHQVV